MESRRRSLYKALSWRVFATLITFLIALVITGKLSFAMEIGLLDTAIKFLTYFVHERAWVRLPFGLGKSEPG